MPSHADHEGSNGSHNASASNWRSYSEAVNDFWARPQSRKRSDHVHEHWLELFIDLILVAFLSNLAHAVVDGGPHPWNYWICFLVFYSVLTAMHFISYVVNLLVIHDACTVLCLFIVTTGIYLMANAIRTHEHWPCKAVLGTDIGYLQSFYAGAIVCVLGELMVYLQVFCFLPEDRKFATIHLIADGIILVYSFVAVVILPHDSLPNSWHNSWYIYLHVMCFIRFVTSIFTMRIRIGDLKMSHLHARLGMLVVITLGEWVIQILTSVHDSWEVPYCILQLFLCFGVALLAFNTRPHIHDESRSELTANFFIGHVHLHYILGFMLFMAGTSIDLEELAETAGGGHHNETRQLSGGHGHSECKEFSGWSIWDSMEFRSNWLGCAHLMVLLIRNSNKHIVLHGCIANPQWKMLIRVCFASFHVFVPSVLDVLLNCDDTRQRCMVVGNVVHFVIMMVSVFADISGVGTRARELLLGGGSPPVSLRNIVTPRDASTSRDPEPDLSNL